MLVEAITAAIWNEIARNRNKHKKPYYSYEDILRAAKAAELEYKSKENGKID